MADRDVVRVRKWRRGQVVGKLHEPSFEPNGAIALAHGAGGDRNSPLLIAMCNALARLGWAAVRLDLPFRQERPQGPPSPSGAARDREGLLQAAEALWELADQVYLGGSSYGGRQASMLAAEQPEAVNGLLLLSYPLHPPGKPEKRRTEHFPKLAAPAFFAHGSRDAFGDIAAMEEAIALIPAPTRLLVVEGVAHGLIQKRDSAAKSNAIAAQVAEEFDRFISDYHRETATMDWCEVPF